MEVCNLSQLLWYTEHLSRKHIFRDLQPYVCTFPNCPQADEQYGSQRKWFDHEVQLHQREWYCDACSESFPRKSLAQEHIEARHSELVTKEYFEAVISRCERAIVTDIVCPLCGVKFTLQTLEKHLGFHLQEVALFALPHLGEGSSEVSSEDSNEDNSKNGSDTKQPVENQQIISPKAIEEIRCICSYQHDDGFLITCNNCKELQHGVCMGIHENSVPEGYECSACTPGAHHSEIEKAINAQESFLKSYQSLHPTASSPAGEVLKRAIQEYVNQLSDGDKEAFQSAPDIIERLQESDKSLIPSSLTTRVKNVLQCVKSFMSCLASFTQFSPEILFLAVGGVNCILTVGTRTAIHVNLG